MNEQLSRNVLLERFVWAETDGALGATYSLANFQANQQVPVSETWLPEKLLDTSPFLRNKLGNFRYLQSDFEIELKANATPFAQGALIMIWNPLAAEVDALHHSNRWFSALTTYPHVILNLGKAHSATLRIPYTFWTEYLDLYKKDQTDLRIGKVEVFVLSKYKEGFTGANCTVSVFGRMINPKWRVPVSGPALTSFSGNVAQGRSRLNSKTVKKHNKTTKNATGSSGVTPGVSLRDTKEGETTGPVTQISAGMSTIASSLSGVPVIGDFAAGIGWFFRGLNMVAAYFGWSKPTDLTMPVQHIHKPNANFMHSEGKDTSTTLALIQDNSVVAGDQHEDEMHLNALTTKWNMMQRYPWLDSDVPGTRIGAFNVCPITEHAFGLLDSGEMFVGSLGFAASLASFWRGSIKYKIEFYKTQYHNGRILVVHFPNLASDEIPDDFTDEMTTNYSILYDITNQTEKDCEDLVFEVFYLSTQPWKETVRVLGDNFVVPPICTNGSVGIYVVNKLQSPPNISSNIDYGIFYSAGADFELARPTLHCTPGYVEPPPDPPPAAKSRQYWNDKGNVAQGSIDMCQHRNIEVKPYTVGEYFTSLRQLLKRNMVSFRASEDFTGIISPLPFITGDEFGTRPSNTDITYNMPHTWMGTIAHLYRMYYGSYRSKIIPKSQFLFITAALKNALSPLVTDNSDEVALFQSGKDVGALEVNVPYYSKFIAKPLHTVSTRQTQTQPHTAVQLNVENSSTFTQTNSVIGLESGGDDLSFFLMVGPPVLKPKKWDVVPPLLT
jgi:hypothetical protein